MFTLGLVLASFAPSLEIITLTFGLLTGSGAGMACYGILIFVSNYYPKRAALVSNVVLAGVGCGAIVAGYLSPALEVFGWREGLRVWAGVAL